MKVSKCIYIAQKIKVTMRRGFVGPKMFFSDVA